MSDEELHDGADDDGVESEAPEPEPALAEAEGDAAAAAENDSEPGLREFEKLLALCVPGMEPPEPGMLVLLEEQLELLDEGEVESG